MAVEPLTPEYRLFDDDYNRLVDLVLAMADRIDAQKEILSRRAEGSCPTILYLPLPSTST